MTASTAIVQAIRVWVPLLPVLFSFSTGFAGKYEPGPAEPLRVDGNDGRPLVLTTLHNLSNIGILFTNVGMTGSLLNDRTFEWPMGQGSSYLYYGDIWASAFGSVTPSGTPGAYVSRSTIFGGYYEFRPTEGFPMVKFFPGPTAHEETTWGEDDWSSFNENPMGVRTLQRAYSWSTPGYNEFFAQHITITHLSQFGNPGVPLKAFCFSFFADFDIASADPSPEYYADDVVFYDGHAIWCNDPDATCDYVFDNGMRASEEDAFIWQRNPDASWSDPDEDIFYHYNYPGSDGIVDADVNSDGVSDHFTVLFKTVGPDTIFTVETNTGLELFKEGRPANFWLHTVGDTTYAVVPRNTGYMWDGDDPESFTDDSGEPTLSPPCNGFAGWRLLDLWVKKADGTVERPIDVFGCPVPLSHTWWEFANDPYESDALSYDYQWGLNQDYSGRHSGPAYLAEWIGHPNAPHAFQPANPGPFPIVHDNPLAMGFQPFDYSLVLTMGPLDLEDGDSLHIVGGWVVGRGLDGLRHSADILLDAYCRDGGWGVPDVPPIPTLFYEAGDGTVDLVWSDDSEVYEPFGGYRLYRSVFNTSDWELVGTFPQGTYSHTDSTVTRGYPYYYALCSFDLETGVESAKTNFKKTLDGTPIPVVPGWTSGTDWKEHVAVVPNPYRGAAQWESQHAGRLAFINLPPMCDIRIYTLDGDQVAVMQHRDFGGQSSQEYWDMTNGTGRSVCTGLYVFTVQTSDDHYIGRFAVIR